MRVATSGWWPSGEQSMTQTSSQRLRRYSRMRSKPGPLRKPATVMYATMPLWPLPVFGAWSNTFHVAQRQK
jgi:hypothetical protein